MCASSRPCSKRQSSLVNKAYPQHLKPCQQKEKRFSEINLEHSSPLLIPNEIKTEKSQQLYHYSSSPIQNQPNKTWQRQLIKKNMSPCQRLQKHGCVKNQTILRQLIPNAVQPIKKCYRTGQTWGFLLMTQIGKKYPKQRKQLPVGCWEGTNVMGGEEMGMTLTKGIGSRNPWQIG